MNTAALDAEVEGLLASVKNGCIVLESISAELKTLRSGADTVEAELAHIDEEFAASEAERQKEEAAMIAEMQRDIAEETAEDAADAE